MYLHYIFFFLTSSVHLFSYPPFTILCFLPTFLYLTDTNQVKHTNHLSFVDLLQRIGFFTVKRLEKGLRVTVWSQATLKTMVIHCLKITKWEIQQT